MASITSANAIITLTIPGLFSIPQQLQGFSADNIYDMATQEIVQTMMGVDGKLSGGFVFNPIEQTFDLMADSASKSRFSKHGPQRSAKPRTFILRNGETTLISVNKSYICNNGFLLSLPPAPSAGRVLQPRKYVIRWESIQAVRLNTSSADWKNNNRPHRRLRAEHQKRENNLA